jgi:hypothetical protein
VAQIIQIRRRIPGTGAPTPGTVLAAGEPAVAVTAGGVAELYVGDGAVVRTLVSNLRQVEVTGDQSVAGEKTFTGTIVAADPSHLDIGGGNAGDILSTDGAGVLDWIPPPKGVHLTQPTTPEAGDIWYNSANNELRVYNGSAWVIANVTVAGAAPGTPTTGKLWYNTTTHVLSVWNGTAWAPTTGNRAHFDDPGPPSGTHATGDIWFSPTGPQYWDGSAWELATLPGFAGVATQAPITGDGQAGTPLGLTVATTAQIEADPATNNTNPITPQGLRTQLGLPVDDLETTAQTVVPAINELVGDITTLQQQLAAVAGALRFVGNFDAAANEVTSADTGTLTVGQPLPAASGTNQGWFVIVTDTGSVTLPGAGSATAMEAGDWIVSTGTAWIHVPLYHVAMTAANIGITAVDSQSWTNVQAALQGIFTMLGDALTEVEVDGVSIIGDGTTSDPLEVAVVDGGTY